MLNVLPRPTLTSRSDGGVTSLHSPSVRWLESHLEFAKAAASPVKRSRSHMSANHAPGSKSGRAPFFLILWTCGAMGSGVYNISSTVTFGTLRPVGEGPAE